jgi:hypothetical protein
MIHACGQNKRQGAKGRRTYGSTVAAATIRTAADRHDFTPF